MDVDVDVAGPGGCCSVDSGVCVPLRACPGPQLRLMAFQNLNKSRNFGFLFINRFSVRAAIIPR